MVVDKTVPYHLQAPAGPGQPFSNTVSEMCDRIKEELNYMQAQNNR